MDIVQRGCCCVCERPMGVHEVAEFYGLVDEALYGEPHCRICLEAHLTVCRECSVRRTADPEGLCGECAARGYGLVG
jgi:hypothetical protein